MTTKKTIDTTVFIVAVILSLVFINIIGVGLFVRLDMTHDKQFTLSRATRKTLDRLDDPISVKAYFTKDLPPPHSSTARYVRDLLEEYYAAANGNFSYSFIDPVSEETDEDKEKKKEVRRDIFGRAVRQATSIERELQSLGIPPIQVRVNEDDKIEIKRGYMGIAIKHGSETEVIPLVRESSGLEYDMTTLIRKLVRPKTPKLAVVTELEGQELQKAFGRMFGLLSQTYDVTPLNLRSSPEIADDVDALIVLGPKGPFSIEEQETIDAFVMSGRSVAFLLDNVKPDLGTMGAEEADHGLHDMLATYGVTLGNGLVVDAECATINISQQRGFMRISQPVKYPFMPLAKALNPNHPLTRGLAQVAFPFMMPLTLALTSDSEVEGEVLVRSSAKSFIQTPPYNLDPFQKWTADRVQDEGEKVLVVTLKGAIPSHFNQGPTAPEPSEDGLTSEKPPAIGSVSRVLVAGGSSFVNDQFLSRSNEVLLLNLVDWLVLDEDLLEVRSRGLAAAPLDELSDGARNTVKYVNMLGVPLAFILFGLVRWRLREARRANVTL
ncbi:MAG: GldG family protein [Myxococcota bacterium]